MGIALCLFVVKQVGIFIPPWLMVVSGLAKRPAGTNWLQIYGASIVCGIGFTMSLFIGGLAFEAGDFYYAAAVRMGVMEASLAAALWGYFVLRYAGKPPDQQPGT